MSNFKFLILPYNTLLLHCFLVFIIHDKHKNANFNCWYIHTCSSNKWTQEIKTSSERLQTPPVQFKL